MNYPEIDILSCIDGFSIILESSGKIIHVSNSISDFIGIDPVSMNIDLHKKLSTRQMRLKLISYQKQLTLSKMQANIIKHAKYLP